MTVEKAKQASEILDKIKELSGVRERFFEAEKVVIQTYRNNGVFMSFDSELSSEKDRYIQYILRGLDSDIEKLNRELERL